MEIIDDFIEQVGSNCHSCKFARVIANSDERDNYVGCAYMTGLGRTSTDEAKILGLAEGYMYRILWSDRDIIGEDFKSDLHYGTLVKSYRECPYQDLPTPREY